MPEKIILVVDDDPINTQVCSQMLNNDGYKVLTALGSLQALEVLRKERVDVLLTDIRMPLLTGLELGGIAQQQNPYLAVLAMTGYGSIETAIQALRMGVDGLILKPFASPEELNRVVEQAYEDHRRKVEYSRAQTLRPLFNKGEEFFLETDPPRLYQLILKTTREIFTCACAGIFWRENSDINLNLLAVDDGQIIEKITGPEVTPAIRSDQWNIPLVANLRSYDDLEVVRFMRVNQLGSMICLPVIRKSNRYIFFIARQDDQSSFISGDLDLFTLFCQQSVAAIENAQLYSDLKKSVLQIEASQKVLVQTEKLAALGRLIASLAHEVNNPLQSLRNCLHLVGRQELKPEQRQAYLEMAQEELERLSSTVQRTLEYYRPGLQERQLMNIETVVRNVLQLSVGQLQKQHIQLHTRFPAETGVVSGIGSQLQQVFLNLIINAMEAMPEGGDLWVRCEIEQDWVKILVQDTGVGIPAEHRHKIFEPMFSTKNEGSGLGLAISYDIVDAHGGTLNLLDEHNCGACFEIKLPLRKHFDDI
jgi:signal transduction histidine kinase/CheY-like chemotaxis protein